MPCRGHCLRDSQAVPGAVALGRDLRPGVGEIAPKTPGPVAAPGVFFVS